MTDEELTRFALALREADRIRTRVSKDEAAARASCASQPPPAEEDQSSWPAVAAAA